MDELYAIVTPLKGGKAMRTPDFYGWFWNQPKIGEGFQIINDKPLNMEYGNRWLYTSDVVAINKLEEGLGGWIIDTITGSQYKIALQ